ncbi:hypothetical protein IWX90DRAFT_490435 [Phyllosticta citrichinensis]|uniref:Uncharacterized protein n=1 Tax=Phyllosticta citrichinensis TaxID=1130410 RepID=A0ABR1XGS0_9PEZI
MNRRGFTDRKVLVISIGSLLAAGLSGYFLKKSAPNYQPAPPVVSAHHSPGVLSDACMSTFGDFFVQAANPVCPRSTEPVSTYSDYLAMLQSNNTMCYPSEVPPDLTMKFYMALGLGLAQFAKLLDTVANVYMTFSPLTNIVTMALFFSSILSLFACAFMVGDKILQAWHLARTSVPIIVMALISAFIDQVVEHFLGRNNRRAKLVLLTCKAIALIIVECSRRYIECHCPLLPNRVDYISLTFNLAVFCTIPVVEFVKPQASGRLMLVSFAALAFVGLHDTICWLLVCTFESFGWPWQIRALPILGIQGSQFVLFVFGFVLYLFAEAWVWIQQQTYCRGFEQLIDRAIQRCKMSVRPILNPGPKASGAIIVFSTILWYFGMRFMLNSNSLWVWETQRQDFVSTLQWLGHAQVKTLQRLVDAEVHIVRRLLHLASRRR